MVTLSPNAPNPIGAMADPESDEDKLKPERNRNVASPGSRGGHYRRVWSNKLHKFYIKYGKGDSDIDVENADDASRGKVKPQIYTKNSQLNNIALPSRIGKEPLDELLNGLYEELLRHYNIGPEGSGKHHGGRAITFGRITRANGELVSKNNFRQSFHLYSQKGKPLQHMERTIRQEKKIKEFFCYMVARYAMAQFMDGKKEQQMSRSLLLRQDQGSDILKKAYAKLLVDTVAFQHVTKEETSSNELQVLKRSLEGLRQAHQPRAKQRAQQMVKSLIKADKYLERLEKAGPKETWNKVAPAAAGNRYGSVGGGNNAVYRLPGRPRGSGNGMTAASASMPMSAGVTITSTAPMDAPTSDVDWAKHRHLRIGARVKVQHPFEHERPVWGRISDIGEHGVQVTDDEGNVSNIRWHHIQDLQQRIDNTPQNAFEIAKFRIPVQGVSGLAPHQMDAAEKELRKLAMPMGKDVIHSGHDDRAAAYTYMFSEKYPIDDIEATRKDIDENGGLTKLTEGLINHALSMRVPVDADLLRELPFDRVISVIHHHLNSKKDA